MESRSGTPSADELLAHSSFVRWLAFDLVGNADEAEEVAQETLVRALERPRPVRVTVAAWLAGVTRNVVRMRRRAAGRRARRERVAARPEGLPSAADSVAAMEVLRRLTDAVAELPEPYRATVLLRYYEGLMPAEIARRTGDPVKTVKTRLNRALARLRARLDERTGSRLDWVLLLLPFCPRSRGPVPVVPGAILMTLKSKLAASAVAAALLLALVVVWATRGRDAGPPRGPDAGPDVAAAAPAETADAGDAPSPPVAAAPAATPAGPTGTVRVRVVDAETGQPIPGVAVRRCRLEGNLAFFGGDDDDRAFWVSDAIETARPGERAFTDAEGISSQPVPPGPWVVLVRHPRYRDFVGPRFPVRAGDTREFEIRLVPFPPGEREIDFSGTVTDGATTDPLDGVRVTGTWREGPALRTAEAVTAPDGGYSLTIPVNAPVEIHFAKHGYEERPILVDPLLLPWIGGDAVMAPVHGGPRRGEGRLDGRVVDLATGKPVAGAQVTLERGLGPEGGGGIGSWGDWRSDEAGRFRIDLEPMDGRDERVAVVVRREGYAEHVSDPVVLSPDRTTPVVVALAPASGPPAISGRVVEAGTGRPIAGARVVTEEVFGDPLATTTSDAEGRFELPGFGDVHVVRATAEGHGAATAKPGRDVVIELPRADAVLRGTVVDARSRRPLAGAMVTLFTAPDGYGPGPLTVTDERGEYELGVPPGAYFVRARLEGYGPAVSHAVEATSRSRTTVDLAMIAADATVRGTARDASSGEELLKAAEGVRILRRADDGDEHGSLESHLDAYDGGIRVDVDGAAYSCSLTPGRYLLVVNLGGYLPVREEFVLAAGETRTLDLDVEPHPPLVATVRGIVRRGGTGEAVAEAEVVLRHRGARLGRARTDADGRFELRAPAGECVVEATTWVNGEPVTREAKATPTAGQTVDVEIVIGG